MGRRTVNVSHFIAVAFLVSLTSMAPVGAKKAQEQKPATQSSAQDGSATTSATADGAPQYVQELEQRLFFKNYPKEPIESRAARIEKQTFGDAVDAPIEQRLARLQQLRDQQRAEEAQQMLLDPNAAPQQPPAQSQPATGAGGDLSGSVHQSDKAAPPTQPPSPAEAAERERLAVQAAREEEMSRLLSEGVELYRNKHGMEAQQKFFQVLRLDPANPEAHFNVGIIKESEGKYVEAQTHYQLAAKAQPNNPDYADAVKAIAAKAEKQKQVIGDREQLKNLASSANAAWKRGEFLSALDQYLQLDAQEPNKALVKYNIGSIYMMLHDKVNALEYYKQAHKLEGSEPKYQKAYGELKAVVAKEESDRAAIDKTNNAPAPKPQHGHGTAKTPQQQMQQMPQQMYAQQPMQQMPQQMYAQQPMQQVPQQQMQQMPQQMYAQQPMQQMMVQQQMPQQGMVYTQQMQQPQPGNMVLAPPPVSQVQQTPQPRMADGRNQANPFATIMAGPTTTAPKTTKRAKYGMPSNMVQQYGLQPTVGAAPLPVPQQASAVNMAAYGFAGKGNGEGVTVTKVLSGSRAEAAGLQRGDDIRAVDGDQIASTTDIEQILARASTNRFKVVVLRNGNLTVLNF